MSSSIIPKEHDYIGGLSGTTSSTESISDKLSSSSSPSTKTLQKPETQAQNITSCLKETELRLGLPGSESPDRAVNKNFSLVSGAKRGFSHVDLNAQVNINLFSSRNGDNDNVNTQKTSAALPSKLPVLEKNSGVNENTSSAPAAKAQVVGWPPIRSFRKNSMASNAAKNSEDAEGKSGSGCLYVKVSMDGAPYLRKVDLKTYANYVELSSGLEKMFSCFTIGQCGTHGFRGRDGLTETCLKDLLHGSEYVLTYEDKDGDWMLVGDVPWEMFTDTCRRLRITKGSEAIGLAPRTVEKSRSRN